MKVLFLDVDGVLNSAQWFEADRRRDGDYLGLVSVDPVAVAMILGVVHATGAKIVLSSTWRLVDHYVQALKDAGLSFYSMTPVLRTSNRGEEIKAWLKEHPEVDCFAIVDDDADAGDCGLRSRFVKTNFATGLQDEHVGQLIRLLGLAERATLAEA
jgi:hypothetical protein